MICKNCNTKMEGHSTAFDGNQYLRTVWLCTKCLYRASTTERNPNYLPPVSEQPSYNPKFNKPNRRNYAM